jgi:hypothetical protein
MTPREEKVWKSTGTFTAIPPYTEAEMEQRLDDVLRRSARVLSLILDRDRTPDAEPNSLFHRGWAKAPMWANYAGSRINYIDRLIRLNIIGTFADQAELDEELYTFLETRYEMSALHMTRNTDWAYETELRLAVVDRDLTDDELDTPINLPLGN